TFFAFVMSAVFIVSAPLTFPNGLEKGLTPSEYAHFRIPLNKAFLWTHLASVLPAGLLAVTQFIPRIRQRAIKFHRNAGTVINILTVISTFSAVGVGRVSFGGDFSIQSGVYALALMTLWSMMKSWTAIRRLDIDEHRKWIIRSWSYQMSVITLRAIAVLLMVYISVSRTKFYQVSLPLHTLLALSSDDRAGQAMPCDEIEYVLNDEKLYARDFPQCQANWTGSPATHAAVQAGVNSHLAATAGIRAKTEIEA
ncbi:hypothetical protein FRC07_009784, partial [Ceratobasidium sp. 392]